MSIHDLVPVFIVGAFVVFFIRLLFVGIRSSEDDKRHHGDGRGAGDLRDPGGLKLFESDLDNGEHDARLHREFQRESLDDWHDPYRGFHSLARPDPSEPL